MVSLHTFSAHTKGVVLLGTRSHIFSADLAPEPAFGGPSTATVALFVSVGVLLALGWAFYWSKRGRSGDSARD